MYSYRIEQAIRAAAVLHKDQVRKGSVPLPYITHLLAVAMIVEEYTSEEDVVIAALLHDTLEDTDYTAEELQEDFGETVLKIVESLSEPQNNADKKYTWREQKQRYAAQLKKASLGALLIAAADKIHNMRSIVEDYHNDHPRFLNDFPGSLDDRALAYQDIANVINSKLTSDIISEFNTVYTEYKNFILNVKKTTEKSRF